MSVLLIEEDNRAIVEAIEQKDLGRIMGCIQNFYRKYPDDNTISYYEDALDDKEKDEFKQMFPNYEGNVKRGLTILNTYIQENLDNFLNLSDQKKFLGVTKTLISIDRLNIASVDAERLCKSFLECLSSTTHEEIFQKTYEILTIPVKSHECDQDGNAICKLWTEHVLGDRDFLLKILNRTYGKNYRYIKNIFMAINNIQMPETDTKLFCIIHGECQKFIPSEKSYFIAFPFNYGEIEDKIIEAFSNKFSNFKLYPRIAKGLIETGTALCQICGLILSSKFGIYVLNKYSSDVSNRYFPNPNVMLELGLTIGRGKKFIILLERGTTVPADLHGYIRIEYDNIEDIPVLIYQQDFRAFYNEED
jgi:hypothetical protein